MDWASILTIIISILVPMFGGFFWIISRIDRLDRDLTDLKVQVGKLETRVEERTLRTIPTDTGTHGK